MSPAASLLLIAGLILASAFFSISEISIASARRMRLRQLADDGDERAARVLELQEQPGRYITLVQIGLNAVTILGGIVGEGVLSPVYTRLLERVVEPATAQTLAFLISFSTVTALFLLFADLFPKRVGIVRPEQVAMRIVGPLSWLIALLAPLVWIFERLADGMFKLFGLPQTRDDRVTHHDILAMAEAGTAAGTMDEHEQQVIVNVFELETRTVESAMTARSSIVWFNSDDATELIRARIAVEPHSTYLVCNGSIDKPAGYVDAKDLLSRMIADKPIALTEPGLLHKVLIIPDRLTLAEVLTQFRTVREDFAVIMNEYSLVVGVITLNDVMSTVMGSMVTPYPEEQQIVQRDDGSWLIDGVTPVPDVLRALDLDELPHTGQYDTLAGFMMVMLRRIPRRTDVVEHAGLRFEVMDVDDYKIDQVLVTRVVGAPPA
ncbi:hemolysin family protein [Rivibacter subsaxonicus]|uniref:CBS domain containing-hemolysin-like protein n=1 Tax=Rivibacter subsaxonicus TaxID=457575 RepID=A0A4Q7W1U8_9BURK|nr:hemolysin family protein [Rivibacter subsaxonicus]RZU02908.1 CBS domain containing-hemolysin-like protein [Rivibacter subsaxonicus]